MADGAHNALRRFRSWIEKPSAEDARTLFAPNIVYDKGWGQRVGDEFFDELKGPAFDNIKWVAESLSESAAALAYSATDPVTMLRYHVVCMIDICDGRITSLVEARAIIPPDIFLQYVKGDATRPMIAGPQVIAHVCNDLGRWGKGFVVALSRRWTEPENAYRAWASGSAATPFALGEVQFVEVKPTLWVANMVAQHGIRPTKAGPPIRYEALATALAKVAAFALEHDATVHMPRIGCGLAGGDWAKVEPLVNESLASRSVQVFVYDLPGSGG